MGYTVLTQTIAAIGLGEAIGWSKAAIEQGQQTSIITANPEMLMQARQHPGLADAMAQAGLIIPDGAGVVWALKVLHQVNTPRLPGIELAEALLAEAARHHWRVAIVGASDAILTQAVENLQTPYPGLNLVYTHHGYVDNPDSLIPDVVAAKPNLVLAALGVPRQETWLQQVLAEADESTGLIGMGVGGSVDVWSGTKQRAPAMFRALNLEWLYRITSEPWRLKRVYKTLPAFVLQVLAAKLFPNIRSR